MPTSFFRRFCRSFALISFFSVFGGCSTVHVSLKKVARKPRTDVPSSHQIQAASLVPLPKPQHPSYNSQVEKSFLIAKSQRFHDSAALVVKRAGRDLLDPSSFDEVFLASDLKIKGLTERSVYSGVGVPLVLWAKKGSPILNGQPGIPNAGIAVPATLLLSSRGGTPILEFHDTMKSDHAMIEGHRYRLSTDFSAPVAYCISKGQNRTLDLKALIHTKQNLINAGLIQIQKYDPNKVPVIFVHGLLCRPEAWTAATNQLLSDPAVRKHYQFWYFRYPTGLPVWASAALLRSEMDRFQKRLDPQNQNPNMRRIILVGHSMGGLISDLMIRKGGPNLWRQFATQPMEQLVVKPATKKHMEDLIDFEPRKDVARVVFVATPHRGSPLALKQLASFLASFIKLPYIPLNSDMTTIRQALRSDMRRLFSAPVNGILCLKAQSPILLSILKLPRSEKVPYHSIIGDQGKHNSPNSSDGIVPYWSSHVEGAVSEKVVFSGHGANENSEGIKEIDRILVSALKE
jgi:pimeloyl-ACP methyl ester carboxylesterase